jgi:hypothetical protein
MTSSKTETMLTTGRSTPPAATKVPLLPGETAVRSDLIDQAVREINRIYVGKGLEAARGIGEFVLRTFFDNSMDTFRAKGKKHISFRKLVERDDLRVSHVHLRNCVVLVDQLKALPVELANALPVSHHTVLLPVHDEKAKVVLARKAVRENLSKRALETEVRRLRPRNGDGTRRGRPPTPAAIKAVALIVRAELQLKQAGAELGRDLNDATTLKLAAALAAAERRLTDMLSAVHLLRRQLEKEHRG